MKATVAMISALLLSSCGYYYEKRGGVDENLNIAVSSVDFAAVQNAIFTPYCVSCHQQYSSYAPVRRELTAIAAAINSGRMPKIGGPLSTRQKQLLETWIAAGAPETAGNIPEIPAPLPLAPNYESIAENIFTPKCAACHNPVGQAKFLDLSSRQAILAARDRGFGDGTEKLFNTEAPEQSYILQVIQDPAEPMPPRTSGIAAVTEKQIAVLKEWIARGIP